VRRDVAVAHDGDPRRQEERGDADQCPARDAPPEAAVGPARPPQRDGAEREQQQPGREAQQAREVVSRRTDLACVVIALDPTGDSENAEDEREEGASEAAQARVCPPGQREQRERHQPADEVVAGGGAGLGLEVVVVDDMQRDDGERGQEEEALPAPPVPPRARRDGGGHGGRHHS